MPTSVAPLALARLAASTARSCAGVVSVDPGPSGVAATHGPGGRVPGVTLRIPAGAATVHLVVGADRSLPEVAEDVRRSVAGALTEADPEPGRWTVDVHIADIDLRSATGDGPLR